MRRFTKTGRVVYDRPKHLFGIKDIMRIGKKLGAAIFSVRSSDWEALASDLIGQAEVATDFKGFSGGTFGGGGATGDFSEGIPLPVPAETGRVIIMIEEKES